MDAADTSFESDSGDPWDAFEPTSQSQIDRIAKVEKKFALPCEVTKTLTTLKDERRFRQGSNDSSGDAIDPSVAFYLWHDTLVRDAKR